ncbi:hypothetical protein ACQR1W_08640 [Bradyrhizobium sp. HKCCYLS1011]
MAGFMTPDGIDAAGFDAMAHATKISELVIGAGTYRAFEAIDSLISAGVPLDRVRIHLGHNRSRSATKNLFQRYHPMLHSKIYLFEMTDGSSAALIGSHNVTGFALRGLNGEAGVLLEGASSDAAFADIRRHIAESFAQAVPYDPTMKEAYAWWTREYFDGLRIEANDAPKDSEGQRTIVILAAVSSGRRPKVGDIIYFEIAEDLSEIDRINAEVHIYLFSSLPAGPAQALSSLKNTSYALFCKTEGIEMGRGGLELDADWNIEDRKQPELRPTKRPFRPVTSRGMQQTRVRVLRDLTDRYDYLFDDGRSAWVPEFGEEPIHDETRHEPWLPVKGLVQSDLAGSEKRQMALIEASPQSGSFILFSRRRRRAR